MDDGGFSRRRFIGVVTGAIAGPVAGAIDSLARSWRSVAATSRGIVAAAFAAKPPAPTPVAKGPLQIALASTRTQFTTAEPVEIALAYAGSASRVALRVVHEDGSEIAVDVPLDHGSARVITIPAGTLKAGTYEVIANDGKPVVPLPPSVGFAVHRDEHPSAYFIGSWMQTTADAPTVAAKGGWMYFTSDLIWASARKPGPDDIVERYVAARMKPFSMCVMGGGHQLDMDLMNDWSDPWVQRAVTWKMGLAALSNRVYPAGGIHAFDEPGLTWWPIGRDAKGHVTSTSPFSTPVPREEFELLTGVEIPSGPLPETLPRYVERMSAWLDFIAMRLKYLEQAWWAAVTAVRQVHPRFLTINQVASSYAPGLVTDGVDNRMNRPYQVVSGHGGYSEGGSWAPLVSARAYDGWSWDRPHYYLPMWGSFDYAQMRQEVWLPWSTKLEGIQYDPHHEWNLAGSYGDSRAVLEIAEVNRRLAIVGDIMRRMPRTLAPVAVLMSHTQSAYDLAMGVEPTQAEAADPAAKASRRSAHRAQVIALMKLALSTGVAPNWIDEYEVVTKGAAFLRQWKVVYCPGLAIAKPELRDTLERYVVAGGRLVQGTGDELQLAGATRVPYADAGAALPPQAGFPRSDYAERKERLERAPGFARDLAAWCGQEEYASHAPPNAMLMNVQRAGSATYLLFANNSQDPTDARHTQLAPIPFATTIDVPTWGVLYDLLEGGTVAAPLGKAPLHLAAGDGACWLHLPAAPGPVRLAVSLVPSVWALDVDVAWGSAGYLPFRLRIVDPSGNVTLELLRATTPEDSVPLSYGDDAVERASPAKGQTGRRVRREIGATSFAERFSLGANSAPGTWTVEIHESLTGSTTRERVTVPASAPAPTVNASATAVSIYFSDAERIIDLFAGRALEPPFEKMNFDCRRVFGLDAKKFAVFGPAATAEGIASPLRAKGMTVAVNPAYEIVPFTREPDRGGTGPIQDAGKVNFENIYAHTIVLPGHALGQRSWERGHVNRPVTPTFPGPGRAYVQWGMGGYQAGFENVWVFGDSAAGVDWLLAAIEGKNAAEKTFAITARAAPRSATRPRFRERFVVGQEIKVGDTPVGIGTSPDGSILFVLLAGGTVAAYDGDGRRLWNTAALQDGECLSVSPRGDRIAVGGFPGLLVLDAANGRIVSGYRAPALARDQSFGLSRIVATVWSADGAMVAGGGVSDGSTSSKGGPAPAFPLVVLDAEGNPLPSPPAVSGDVMGMAFIPGTRTLVVGANALTALDLTSGKVVFKGEVGGARSIAFSADGTTIAAGGFGKRAGSFRATDGKLLASAAFPSNVGGVAILPGGDLAVAVWGGTHPLYLLRATDPKPVPLAQARYAFHDVVWLAREERLVAAEEGGNLWLFDRDGKARAKLEDAGTTIHRIVTHPTGLVVGRMNRVVQRLRLG
jgi:hypothetical protein